MLSCVLMSIGVHAETSVLTLKSGKLSGLTTSAPKTVTSDDSSVSWTFTMEGTGILQNFDGTKGQQFGSKSSPIKSLKITSSDFTNYKIQSIIVETSGASSVNATLKVSVGDVAFKYNNAESYKLNNTNTSVEFVGEASGDILIDYSVSARAIYINSITVTYTESDQGGVTLEDPILDWGTDFVAAYFDEENEFPTLNASEDLDSTKLSYSSSDETVATVNSNGEVTLLAGGQTIITASYAGDGVKYNAKSAEYTLNVSALGDIMLNGKTDTEATVYVGEEVKLTASNGTIVYTINGGDPINSEFWTPTEVGTYTINVTATWTPREITHTKTATFNVEVTKAPTIKSATLSFADEAQRTSYSTTQQVWEQNGVKLTNNKASSTSNVGNYYNPARFYKNSEIIIEFAYPMTKIEFDCAKNASYLQTVIGGAASISGSIVTMTFETPANSCKIVLSAGQVQMNSLTIYYAIDEQPSDKTSVSLAFPEKAYTITYGDEFTAPTLTIDPAEAAAEVVYSSENMNVADVDANGNVTIVGAGETTITASISGSETYADASASYTLTVKALAATVATLTDFIAAAPSVETIITEPVTVYYQSPDKKYTFITDGTSNLMVYGSLPEYKNGDVLTGISGTMGAYGGVPQMTPIVDTFGEATAGTPIEPKAATLAETIDICEYVVLTGVSISGIDGKNATLSDGTNELPIYNQFGVALSEVENATVVGIGYEYNGNKQIYVISFEEGGEVVVELGAIEFNGAALEEGQTCEATVGQEITFSAENAETISYTIGEDTQDVEGSSITWTPSAAGTYNVTVTATLGEQTKTINFIVTVAEVADAAYVKVTEAPADWSGKYLIVYEEGSVAFDGSLATLDAANNNFEVTINDGIIEANETTNAANFTIAKFEDAYSIKSASGYYIGSTADYNKTNELKSHTSTQYSNTISLTDGIVTIKGSNNTLQFNSAKNNMRFRYFKSVNQQPIALYKYTVKSDNPSTAIDEVEAAGNEPAQWYDLNGRRVAAPSKGIYILRQGGKATKYAF